MKAIMSAESFLMNYKDQMLQESIEKCIEIMKTWEEKSKTEASPDEKRMYFVDGYDNLSQSIYNFLHSGYGGYVRNYFVKFHRNPIEEGFRSSIDLVHFVNFVLTDFVSRQKSVAEEIENYLVRDKNITLDVIQRNYELHSKIMKKLGDNPFPPNRMELLETLRSSENINSYIESSITLRMYMENIYKEYVKFDEDKLSVQINEFVQGIPMESWRPVTVTRSKK